MAAVTLTLLALSSTTTEAATLTVCSSGCTYTNAQLQTALNAASPGDTVLVEQNFTYVGRFKLAAKSCAANDSSCYITLRTGVTSTGALVADASFPPADVRITSSYANVLAKFQSSEINAPAIETPEAPAVSRWWKLKWLEVLASTFAPDTSTLVEFGSDRADRQTSNALIPEHFIVEQCYLHGGPQGQFRGISIHANDVTVKDSTVANIKANAEGQAIWINSAVGPFTITNNYLEATAENVLIGGSSGCCRPDATVLTSPAPTTTSARLSTVLDLAVGQGVTFVVGGVEEYTEIASISAGTGDVTFTPALSAAPDVPGDVDWGVVPKNLTFTRNHVTKQEAWRTQTVLVKNIFEVKNLDTALIEGNVFEYSWADGQTGYAILFTVANTGNGNDSTRVRNITFRKNIVRHAAGGFQITGRDVSTNNQPSARTMNISISDNLFYDINPSWGASVMTAYIGTGYMEAYRAGGHQLGPRNVTFNHNTFDQTSGNAFLFLDLFKNAAERPAENLSFQNNIVRRLNTGLEGNNSCAEGNGCWTAHTTGTTPFLRNVIADATCAVYPSAASNWCPTSAQLNDEFANYGAGDYRLDATSPYRNAGTDGKDVGADIAAIEALTSIALSGDNREDGGDPPVELLADDFNDNSIDPAKWSVGLITVPADPTVNVAETGAQLRIGPLKQNTPDNHYNGVVSANGYDLTGAYAEVQAVAIPATNTNAGMLFSLALDDQNHYRLYVAGGNLVSEKKVSNTKTTLHSVPFNAASHAFWRIRHIASTNQIVFEAAPNAGGSPGTYVTLHTVTRELAWTAVFVELRAGTPSAQVNPPGTAIFDNFRAVRP